MMRHLLLSFALLFAFTPVLANPFEEKPKEAQPDYDQVPNDLPIGLTFQVLDADMLSAFGIQGQSVGLAVTEVDRSIYNEVLRLDIESGDVITHLNGEPVKGLGHYKAVVDRAKPNSEVVIRFFRHGANKEIKLFRVHAFGLYCRYFNYISKGAIKGCSVSKYNNHSWVENKSKPEFLKGLFKDSQGVFMVECNGKKRFEKVVKKKFFGLWSQMMFGGSSGWI